MKSCRYRLLPGKVAAITLLLLATTAHGEEATIFAQYPHDREAFTQGLLYGDGMLFESTGQYGRSSLRRVDVSTGRITDITMLADHYFGEGLALARGQLYQLTWKAGVAFVYEPDTLRVVARHRYAGEGWGLAWDGSRLIMSDGSAVLRLIDPDDFSVVGRIRVREDGQPLDNLNELEMIDGEIWANIWHQDRIVRIEPASGQVIGSIDAAALRAALPEDNSAGVLNGIAWDADRKRIFVTGKNWPRLFRIALPQYGSDQPE